MRRLFTILFLFFVVKSFAQTKYYISPSGNDATGTGSSGNPWATLYKAANTVTTSGDTIYVNAGTYNETNQSNISVGVSIEGAGQGISNINYNSSTGYAIVLASGTPSTDGNQHISGITIDGVSLAGYHGIEISNRNNVIIHHVTISNFRNNAIEFYGGTYPSGFAVKDEMYNDSIINCTSRQYSGGAIYMEGTLDSLLIHDCYLKQVSRAATYNGNIIGDVNGYLKNFKFYNNTSIKPDYDGSNWNFHLETWNSLGGNEMYGNTFIGGTAFDAGYHYSVKGESSYSWSIHDNLFELTSSQANNDYIQTGINFETSGGDMLIYDNNFKNLPAPIEIEGNPDQLTFSNVYIHNNIFDNVGYNDGTFSYAIFLYATPDDTLQNFYIDNNTFKNTNYTIACFMDFDADSPGGILQNVYVRNNIYQGAASWMRFRTFSGIIRDFTLENNICYGNGNSNDITYDTSPPTNLTETGKITSDPLLNSDFTLQSGSPAIGAGINVGYGNDIGAIQTIAPTVNAGADQTITGTSTTLIPTVLFASGHTGTYGWTKISGGGATITGNNITGLSVGIYIFRLTATQDDSQTAYDDMQVTVNATGIIGNTLILHGNYIFK